jgi:hypothetical protein
MILLLGHHFFSAAAAIILAGNMVLQPSSTQTYEFGNGSSVQVENLLQIKDISAALVNPEYLGAGGSGAVFSFYKTQFHQQQHLGQSAAMANNNQIKHHSDKKVAVKYSWLHSAESVRNECNVLRVLEQRQVTGVERCLAQIQYQDDPRRVIIVMEPVFDDAVSNMTDLSPMAAHVATKMLMRTMAQMLLARVVTTDVQPLISKSTGELLLIDMTEATILPSSEGKLSDLDKSLVSEFCNEVISLFSDAQMETASHAFYQEVYRIEASSSARLDDQMRTIIDDLLSIE